MSMLKRILESIKDNENIYESNKYESPKETESKLKDILIELKLLLIKNEDDDYRIELIKVIEKYFNKDICDEITLSSISRCDLIRINREYSINKVLNIESENNDPNAIRNIKGVGCCGYYNKYR